MCVCVYVCVCVRARMCVYVMNVIYYAERLLQEVICIYPKNRYPPRELRMEFNNISIITIKIIIRSNVLIHCILSS